MNYQIRESRVVHSTNLTVWNNEVKYVFLMTFFLSWLMDLYSEFFLPNSWQIWNLVSHELCFLKVDSFAAVNPWCICWISALQNMTHHILTGDLIEYVKKQHYVYVEHSKFPILCKKLCPFDYVRVYAPNTEVLTLKWVITVIIK